MGNEFFFHLIIKLFSTYQEISKAGVIKLMISIPLTLETMQ